MKTFLNKFMCIYFQFLFGIKLPPYRFKVVTGDRLVLIVPTWYFETKYIRQTPALKDLKSLHKYPFNRQWANNGK